MVKWILLEFEKDCDRMYKLKIDCGLDVTSQKFKKFDFKPHSEGLLRRHRQIDHHLKETMQNLVLSFEFDIRRHVEILETLGYEIDTIKCNKCDYKILHEQTNHSEN